MKKDIRSDNSITVNCKIEKQTEELNYALYLEILGKEKVENAYDEDGVNVLFNGIEIPTTPIKIEKIKNILSELEKKGCNYVSIDYHCDHDEYEIFGVDAHSSSEEEIDTEDEKQRSEIFKNTLELRKAAQEYIKEAEKLEKHLNKEDGTD